MLRSSVTCVGPGVHRGKVWKPKKLPIASSESGVLGKCDCGNDGVGDRELFPPRSSDLMDFSVTLGIVFGKAHDVRPESIQEPVE